MSSKLLNLFAVATLAMLASSFGGVVPVAALTTPGHVAHSPTHHHGLVALARSQMSKRQARRQCKARPANAPIPGNETSTGGNNNGGGEIPSSNPGGKVLVAWANQDDRQLDNVLIGAARSYYTWSPHCASTRGECYPMLWSEKQVWEFHQLVPGYTPTVLLGLNEPDHPGQANVNPWAAADLYRNNISIYRDRGWRMASPACTNAPEGIQWQRDFMAACADCGITIMTVHFYGTNPQDLINLVNQYHNEFGLEVWITEFACHDFGGNQQCDWNRVWDFARTVRDWCNNTSYCGRFAPFGYLHDMVGVSQVNQLLNWEGYPTDLAYFYSA